MKTALNMALRLTLICAIAAFALANVDEVTKGPIAASEAKAQREAVEAVLPAFAQLAIDTLQTESSGPSFYYSGVGDSGISGTALSATSGLGYSGEIEIMMGIDPEGIISGVRILRQEIAALGFSRNFSIYDDQDQERLLKTILQELGIDEKTLKARAVATAIDRAKNRGLWPDQLDDGDDQAEQITHIYALYQQRLQQANALDFNDLLMQTVRLLEDHPAVLEKYRQRFHYILVDEFQDTNQVQYRLVHLLASGHGNLCVVGDDDQSIYRWRGAEVGNILGFERDYPGCETIRLEQNYRSTSTILDAAGAVVAHNAGRKVKKLWTENVAGEGVTLETLPDDLEEGRYLANEIGRLKGNNRHLRDIAIFYRTNAQSRVIEEALRNASIPYVMFGGLKFYSRMEIKHILA